MAKTKAVRQEQARFRKIRSFYENQLREFVNQLPGGLIYPNACVPIGYTGKVPFVTLRATQDYIARRRELKLELLPNCYIGGEENWTAYDLLEHILRSPSTLTNFLESFIVEANKYELRMEFRHLDFKVKPGLISTLLANVAEDKLSQY